MKRIAYIQYTNPAGYPPLEHSSRILANQGWNVLVVGINVAWMVGFTLPAHPNIRVRQLPICAPGWRQKLHYVWFTLSAVMQALAWRSDWAYVSDPLACPTGWLLSFWPGICVIYHEHDCPADTSSIFIKMILWTRRRLARRAKLCILPNERRAEQFKHTLGRDARVVCVWNCPTREEVSPERLARNGGDLWMVYQGSIVPARLPATVIEALTRVPESVKLRVIGYETPGHRGYAGQLRALAKKAGVAHRVEFIGTVPTRAELFLRCRQSDVGMAFMPKASRDINEQAMTGASNKPFDYLACGLALLVSDLPDWQTMYVKAGVGLSCDPDDPDSIAAALRWLLDHPDTMREMGEHGRCRILEEWNYEHEFEPVVEVLTCKEA
jgi:glycosyltransferase involved in cell wall biosynthesis